MSRASPSLASSSEETGLDLNRFVERQLCPVPIATEVREAPSDTSSVVSWHSDTSTVQRSEVEALHLVELLFLVASHPGARPCLGKGSHALDPTHINRVLGQQLVAGDKVTCCGGNDRMSSLGVVPKGAVGAGCKHGDSVRGIKRCNQITAWNLLGAMSAPEGRAAIAHAKKLVMHRDGEGLSDKERLENCADLAKKAKSGKSYPMFEGLLAAVEIGPGGGGAMDRMLASRLDMLPAPSEAPPAPAQTPATPFAVTMPASTRGAVSATPVTAPAPSPGAGTSSTPAAMRCAAAAGRRGALPDAAAPAQPAADATQFGGRPVQDLAAAMADEFDELGGACTSAAGPSAPPSPPPPQLQLHQQQQQQGDPPSQQQQRPPPQPQQDGPQPPQGGPQPLMELPVQQQQQLTEHFHQQKRPRRYGERCVECDKQVTHFQSNPCQPCRRKAGHQ